jgi:hypothetical protein
MAGGIIIAIGDDFHVRPHRSCGDARRAGDGKRLNLRVGPLSLEMSDAHLRSIEPPIAIVVSIGRAIALPRYRCPTWAFPP